MSRRQKWNAIWTIGAKALFHFRNKGLVGVSTPRSVDVYGHGIRGNSNRKQIRGQNVEFPTNGNGKSFRRQKTNDARFSTICKDRSGSILASGLLDSHGYSRLRFSKFQAFKWMKRGMSLFTEWDELENMKFYRFDWCWDVPFWSFKRVANRCQCAILWQVL